MATLLELLWQRTDRSGDHWLWQGAVSPDGYPLFTYLGVTRHAHRWMYEEAIGPIPKGAYVLHRCGIRLCMRPSDLYAGDHTQSMRERDAFGRTARGSRHGSKTRPDRVVSGEDHWDSRLDWATVREIRSTRRRPVHSGTGQAPWREPEDYLEDHQWAAWKQPAQGSESW